MTSTYAVLTPAARRRVALMAQAISAHAPAIEKRFARALVKRGFNDAQVRATLALTPCAAGRLRTLNQFLEQVEYNSGRLAKLNVPPTEALDCLREFDAMLHPVLGGCFEPAREQLQLATSLVLNRAYYQVREAETQALFGIYRAEAETGEFDEFLRRLVRVLTPALHAKVGRIFTVDGASPTHLKQPLYIERGDAAERWIADEGMRGRYASYWSYPLGGLAVAQFGFAVKYPWLPRELALLDAAAERCIAAGERARMQTENRELEAESRHAEEEERKRIGRELHDETAQSLLLLRLQLEMMERDAPPQLLPKLKESREIVESAVQEVRRIVAALSPAMLERLGLESAVRQLAARLRKRLPAKMRIRIKLGAQTAPMAAQEAVYRVAQECLQNAAKHSQATSLQISLESDDTTIRLIVSDNGAGFAAAAAGKPMSFGLTGMRERAALLGGTLAVKTAAGKGVRVELKLPLRVRRKTTQ